MNKAFVPLDQMIKDHEAQATQHWGAQKDANTRDMLAKIQGTQDLGELNRAQEDGRLTESALMDKFGAQIDTSGMNPAMISRREILQKKLQDELVTPSLAAADEAEDVAIGAKTLADRIRAAGGHEDFAQSAARQFMEGNQDRVKKYTKDHEVRLTNKVASIDPLSINNYADIEKYTQKLVKEQADLGATQKVDPDQYYGALEKRLRGRVSDKEQRRLDKEQAQRDAEWRRKKVEWGQHDADRLRRIAAENKAVKDATTANLLNAEGVRYQGLQASRNDWINAQRKNVEDSVGLDIKHLKYMQGLVADGKNIYTGFNEGAPDLKIDHIHNEVRRLQEKGVPKADAELIVGLAVKGVQGTAGVKDHWYTNNPAGDTFNREVARITPGYLKYKKLNGALDTLAAKFKSDDYAVNAWQADTLAGKSSTPPTLYDIDTDPLIVDYKRKYVGEGAAGEKGNQTKKGEEKLAAKVQESAELRKAKHELETMKKSLGQRAAEAVFMPKSAQAAWHVLDFPRKFAKAERQAAADAKQKKIVAKEQEIKVLEQRLREKSGKSR